MTCSLITQAVIGHEDRLGLVSGSGLRVRVRVKVTVRVGVRVKVQSDHSGGHRPRDR